MEKGVKAVVEKVVLVGPHGPYAIATTKALAGSVTFSLERNVWQGQDYPEPGEIVFLSKLREKRQGWRAKEGRYWKPSDEQTAEKEEDMLKRLQVFVEGLRNKWFPTGEDKVWKQWVDYMNRDTRSLVNLLFSDVRDGFKRRALFLLLVPSADFNPIYWKKEVGKFYHGSDFLKGLSSDFLSYATDLVVEFCTILKPQHCDRPKNIAEGGGGITVFMQIPDKYHDALDFYNRCILRLLALLPLEQGERIFPLFSLRDISTFRNLENVSGYKPFEQILYVDIDEKWKRAADAEMRRIIQNELAGRAQPREKWEDALHCYANIIQTQLYGKVNYSRELFADQIQFLVDDRHSGNHLIEYWNVFRIFDILSDGEYRELRHRIARFVVLNYSDQHSCFRIYDSETALVADQMMEEFGESDPELANRLKVLIKEGEERKAENVACTTRERKKEEDILSQMK